MLQRFFLSEMDDGLFTSNAILRRMSVFVCRYLTALAEISRHNNCVLRIKSYNKQRKLQEKELSLVTRTKI